MEDSKLLEDILLRHRHKFICGEENKRTRILQNLAKEYSFNSDDVKPACIFIQDSGLPKCSSLSYNSMIVSLFNNRYFELLLSYEIIDKLIKELPLDIEKKVANEVLLPFNYNLGNNKIISLEDLRQELLKTKNIYFNEYEQYLRTGNFSDFRNKIRIFMVIIENMIRSIQKVLPNLDCIQVFINKNTEYSDAYTQVINFYLGARSNGFLNINVGCNSLQEWQNFYDINGNRIQVVHDFDVVEIEQYVLARKR